MTHYILPQINRRNMLAMKTEPIGNGRALGFKGPGRMFVLTYRDPREDIEDEDEKSPVEQRSIYRDVKPFCFLEEDLNTDTVRINVLSKMDEANAFDCVMRLGDLNWYVDNEYIDGRESFEFPPVDMDYPEKPQVGNIFVYPGTPEYRKALQECKWSVEGAIEASDLKLVIAAENHKRENDPNHEPYAPRLGDRLERR